MSYTILIADDSSTLRKIIIRCIQQTQLSVEKLVEAGDGEEALALLRANKIDLLLSDINMPKMSGLELLSAVKADPALKHIPVLLISTEGRVETVVEAANLGAAGYVKKPFTPAEIQAKLEPLLSAVGN
jgi:two-component system, chemotaxis family, chemotaxis protein CheY